MKGKKATLLPLPLAFFTKSRCSYAYGGTPVRVRVPVKKRSIQIKRKRVALSLLFFFDSFFFIYYKKGERDSKIFTKSTYFNILV